MANDRIRLPLTFDRARLREDMMRIEASDWIEHFVKQNYEGTWSVIPLRAPAGEHHPVRMIYPNPTCTEFADTPLLAQCPYFQEVLAAFGAPLDAVRLMKLAAGSAIKEHSDHDLGIEHGVVRLHIPVMTNPDVRFYLNGERVVMNEGECWYLRLSDRHRVVNGGDTDRVHLVIDSRAGDAMLKLLEGALPVE